MCAFLQFWVTLWYLFTSLDIYSVKLQRFWEKGSNYSTDCVCAHMCAFMCVCMLDLHSSNKFSCKNISLPACVFLMKSSQDLFWQTGFVSLFNSFCADNGQDIFAERGDCSVCDRWWLCIFRLCQESTQFGHSHLPHSGLFLGRSWIFSG